jgi:hypothetical protein
MIVHSKEGSYAPKKRRKPLLLFVGGMGVVALSFWGALAIMDYLQQSPAISTEFIGVDQAVNLRRVDVQPKIVGAWTANGQNNDAGPVPLAGSAYGSWSGDDANTGMLTYGGISLKHGPVYLPFVTGPNTDNLVIQLIDAGTGKIVSTISPPVRGDWALLKVALPTTYVGPTEIEMRFIDNGKGWGQWMAVGPPYQQQ